MIDRDLLTAKIGYIEKNLKQLESLQKIPEETFLKDDLFIGAAKYYLQTCIEAMLDIAHHVIARQRYRSPENYVDSFRVLGEEGILPDTYLKVFYQMARFRNRVVHLYHEVDDKDVYKILQTGLSDFRVFIRAMLEHFFTKSG